MKNGIICFALLAAFGCAQKKEFKGAVATGKKEAEAKAVPPPAVAPLPLPNPIQAPSNQVVNQVTTTPKVTILEDSMDFAVEKMASGEVDMFWVIDNSSSMAQEVAQVRANLDKFMESIGASVDIRVTLISLPTGEFGMKLSEKAKAAGHQQFEIEVSSVDHLDKVAISLCSSENTILPTTPKDFDAYNRAAQMDRMGMSPFQICGVNLPNYHASINQAYGYKTYNILGKARDRLRANAAKVIVAVTDDEVMSPILPAQLEEKLGFAKGSLHVYAFAGIPGVSKCQVARPSKYYEEAAKATKGELFDICEKDWSANFAKLSDIVVKVASTNFELAAKKNMTVKSVSIDGVELEASGYVVTGSRIRVLDQTKLASAKSVTVKYSYEAEK